MDEKRHENGNARRLKCVIRRCRPDKSRVDKVHNETLEQGNSRICWNMIRKLCFNFIPSVSPISLLKDYRRLMI